jgi:osmotically-inducible protein OsmY
MLSTVGCSSAQHGGYAFARVCMREWLTMRRRLRLLGDSRGVESVYIDADPKGASAVNIRDLVTTERRYISSQLTYVDITIDKDLKRHVRNALDCEPSVDAKDIGVSVDEGVVILRGEVGSRAERIAAERAALRVYGVKAVAWSSGS